MRRALVGERDRAAVIGLALGFTFHEQLHTAFQPRDVLILPGDHVRQILHRAGEMGDQLFKLGDAILLAHGAALAWLGRAGKRFFDHKREATTRVGAETRPPCAESTPSV